MENNSWKTTNDVFRGYMKARLEDISTDMKEIKDVFKDFGINCDKRHIALDGRIDSLESIESNRSAVAKRMTALMALVVAVVTTLSNIAWKIFR